MPHGCVLVLLPRVRAGGLKKVADITVPSITVRPSREEFHALAAEHTVVPLWAEVLADMETPVSAFLAKAR